MDKRRRSDFVPSDLESDPNAMSRKPREEMMDGDNLKSHINEMLYPAVPDNMTIREFEDLSCRVFDLVWKARGER